MRRLRNILIVSLAAVALWGCGGNDDNVVAQAYGNCLYRSDIEGLVSEGVSAEDSAVIVSNYINQWLQQQVVLEKARKNVKKDFEKELQNYRNSLMVYEYEQMVVAEMLDTNVSEEEIEQYYEEHKATFVLNAPIVRAIWIEVPQGYDGMTKLRGLMSKASLNDDDLMAIQKVVAICNSSHDFDMECWRPLYQLLSDVPAEVAGDGSSLAGSRMIEVKMDGNIRLAHIFAFKGVGSTAPLEFERETIRTIILNKRKIEIINNMQRDLLKEAGANGDIERK